MNLLRIPGKNVMLHLKLGNYGQNNAHKLQSPFKKTKKYFSPKREVTIKGQ